MNFTGTNSGESIQGTSSADLFEMAQGGVDTVNARDGDDQINFGATLTGADRVNGGDGYDTLTLDGDYSAGLNFGSATVRFIEHLEMTEGHSYNIRIHNNTVAAGDVLKVSAYGVGYGNTGHYLRFDGSAETNGKLHVSDSHGNDTLIGGQGDDVLSMSYGGNDFLDGQGGSDVLMAGNNFGVGDAIDGGAGNDVVYFVGQQSGLIQLNGTNFRNVEILNVTGDYGASFQTADSLLADGQMLNVDLRSLAAGQTVNFNGAAEADGWFDFYDGAGNDLLTGGAQRDLFRGGRGGSDLFIGNGGDDFMIMDGALDSSDRLWGGDGYDTLDLMGNYSAGVTFTGVSLVGMERIILRDGYSYKLVFNDGNLKTGESMMVSPFDGLGAGKFLHLDASAESTGRYTMYDSQGNDTLIGGEGHDTFWLEAGGKDKVYGNGGSDVFIVRGTVSNGDTYDGGAGIDRISLFYADAEGMVNLTTGRFTVGGVLGGTMVNVESVDGSGFADKLTGNGEGNYLYGYGGADVLKGEGGNDYLYGGDGDDTLEGGAQDDDLRGEAGQDKLLGGEGNDRLNGGVGDDVLTGGAGADTFCFELGTGRDVVKDYTDGLDRLDFRNSDLGSFAAVQAHMAQVGADVVITAGDDQFILSNVSMGALNAADFLF